MAVQSQRLAAFSLLASRAARVPFTCPSQAPGICSLWGEAQGSLGSFLAPAASALQPLPAAARVYLTVGLRIRVSL